jgi:hypothetical protein
VPTIKKIGAYRFFFFSNEGNEPPHVHIESGDNYAKFWIRPVKLARNYGFNSAELNQLRLLVFENQIFIKEKWDDYFQSK